MGGMCSWGKRKRDSNNPSRRVRGRINGQHRPQPRMIFRVPTVWKINAGEGKDKRKRKSNKEKRKTRPSRRGDVQLRGVRRLFVVCSHLLFFPLLSNKYASNKGLYTLPTRFPPLPRISFLFLHLFFFFSPLTSLPFFPLNNPYSPTPPSRFFC
jgi:hypothetical protein